MVASGVDNMLDWLFGTGRQTNFDDTNKLYGEFDTARNAANKFYDENIGNKDWGTLDNQTRANLYNQYNALDTKARGLSDQYGTTSDLFNQEEKANKNNYFGNGILGALLNPIGQTFDAGMDAITGNYEGRDLASDLGALGETALTFIPGVGLAGKAGKVGKAMTSIPGMAATGAGIGALDTVRQQGSETDLGDALSSAGLGALFGAGVPIAARMGGKMIRNRGGVRGLIPKSTLGKVAAGGGALYGANALLGGQQQQMTPYEQQMMMLQQGGY